MHRGRWIGCGGGIMNEQEVRERLARVYRLLKKLAEKRRAEDEGQKFVEGRD